MVLAMSTLPVSIPKMFENKNRICLQTLINFTNLDEESHHVEELLDADVAIAILIKQIEHLT